MGILMRLAGTDKRRGALSVTLSEFEAFFFQPARRKQLENLHSLETLAEDEASGAPPRAVDLQGNVAVIRLRTQRPEPS